MSTLVITKHRQSKGESIIIGEFIDRETAEKYLAKLMREKASDGRLVVTAIDGEFMAQNKLSNQTTVWKIEPMM